MSIRLLGMLASGVFLLGAATLKQPENCGSRPCTYVITCAAASCTPTESAEVQQALDDARPGDTLRLEAGKTFLSTGWRLPSKDGSDGWITLTTTRYEDLPDENTRITPAWASLLPRLVATTPPQGVLYTENGPLPRPAERYRLIGLMFINRAGSSFSRGLVTIGNPVTFRRAFIADPATNLLTTSSIHSLESDQFVQVATNGTLPGGLQPDVRYYITSITPFSLRLSLTRKGPPVDITDAGAGEHVYIDEGVTRPEHQARDIVIDRCYFTATPTDNVRRAVGIHGSNITVRNSFIEYAKDFATDAQAIVSYNGAGPYTIENNFLEGTGENVLFGGAIGWEIANPPLDPQGVTPADILMRYNYLPKNPARFLLERWKPGIWVEAGKTIQPADGLTFSLIALNSGYTGPVQPQWSETLNATMQDGEVVWRAWSPTGPRRWIVKNNFEIKAAERATIQYNVFDRMWSDGQWFAINFKTENQPTRIPAGEYSARTENILFRDNVIRSAPAALTVSRGARSTARNWDIRNNLFHDIDARKYGSGWERQFQFVSLPLQGLTFEHNTAISGSSGATLLLERMGAEVVNEPIVFRNNILQKSPELGIRGSGAAEGTRTFEAYLCAGQPCDTSSISPNVIAGVNRNTYPPNTFNLCPTAAACDADLSGAKFTDSSDNNFSLAEDSPFRGAASDGSDLGVNARTLPRIQNLRVAATSNKAVVYYQLSEPIQHIPCVLEAGRRPDFSEPVADVNPVLFRRADSDRRPTAVTDGAFHSFIIGSDVNESAMNGNVYSRALEPGTRYFYRLQCGGDTRAGEFTTAAAGVTAEVTVPIRIAPSEGVTEVAIDYGTVEDGAPQAFRTTAALPCESGCDISVPARTGSILYFRARYKTAEGDRFSGVQAIPIQ